MNSKGNVCVIQRTGKPFGKKSIPSRHMCSHLCLSCQEGWGVWSSALPAAPCSFSGNELTHTNAHRQINEVPSTPQCVIHTSVQTGCGRAEGIPLGKLSSAPLSLLSCPRPRCRPRNRRLFGLVKKRPKFDMATL